MRLSRRTRSKLIALLIFLLFGAAGGLFLPGKVVSVADGDTMTFLSSRGELQKIRLYGVDCPESRQVGGRDATEFTRSLVLFSNVKVQVMDKDRYGRAVAIVTLPDGRVLNEELLKNGHAWLYDAYCKTAACAYWRVLETRARMEKTGLWRGKKPVPPWQWRQRQPR